jgi:Fe-S-cluster containining protein
MYVSTIELARFVADLESAAVTPDHTVWDGTGCPFQVGGLCGVHAVRPLGCRTFYCDPTSTEWQNALYERHHAELRTLHDVLGVPYRYVEWRQALLELGLVPRVGRSASLALTVGGRPVEG